MNDVIKEILSVDKGTKWTFRIIAIAFSALCIWMYLFRNGLPEGLAAMTTGAWGTAVATVERAKDKLETITGKDWDGDGQIGGIAATVAEPAEATPTGDTEPEVAITEPATVIATDEGPI